MSSQDKTYNHMDYIQPVVDADVQRLRNKEEQYGSSWKKRGGVGAFMMLARKWDRIENQITQANLQVDRWDILEAAFSDALHTGQNSDNLLDDIADLRSYLLLIEAEVRCKLDQHEDGTESTATTFQ